MFPINAEKAWRSFAIWICASFRTFVCVAVKRENTAVLFSGQHEEMTMNETRKFVFWLIKAFFVWVFAKNCSFHICVQGSKINNRSILHLYSSLWEIDSSLFGCRAEIGWSWGSRTIALLEPFNSRSYRLFSGSQKNGPTKRRMCLPSIFIKWRKFGDFPKQKTHR